MGADAAAAKLPHVISMYGFESLYGSDVNNTNEKEADLLWESYTASGIIALKHSDAKAQDLPPAQDFPWDKDYGLYLISGMHSLHCLKKLRRSLVLSHRNETQMDDYYHLLHCADMLRQDILCHADDTPMYSSPTESRVDTGEGQKRVCRSWNALEQWFTDNSACFAYINETEGVSNEIERYKYCPRGSKFGPRMREYFGFAEDWYEEPIEKVPDY